MAVPKMNPERWARVKEVLDSALGLDPHEREGYLSVACAEDPSLRSEIESLLHAKEQSPDSFMKTGQARASFPRGTRLGEYEVIELLGAGGMGEVYRARDLQLLRDVAIKVLPPVFVLDAERLRRFEQEARATAALNHPNILAIHSLGRHEEQPYIVSELLQGHTLREELTSGALLQRKAIDYALQIARGLAAAHECGIIHRDLKPENIFVTQSGQVKLLDFGLAKLKVSRLEQETLTSPETDAGTVLGTLAYMSPEQVRGQAVDQRTDLFALGAILYEMFTGKRAFSGNSSADLISAILNHDPTEVALDRPDISPAIQRVIARCLEKSPQQRFQSALDVAFALETASDVSSLAGSRTAQVHRRRKWLLLTVGCVLIASAVAVWLRVPRDAVPTIEAFTQLTDDGEPKQSPLVTDGSRLYFNEGEPGSLKLAQVSVAGGQTATLFTKLSNPRIEAIAPDGSALLVLTRGVYEDLGQLWSIPIPAGEPRRLDNIEAQDATFFPDGRIVYANGKALFVTDKGGSNSQKLLESKDGLLTPNISPDSKRIIVTGVPVESDDNYSSYLAETAIEGTTAGELRKIPLDVSKACCSTWTPDERYFLFSVMHDGRWDLWSWRRQASFGQRFRPVRLTSGPFSYGRPLASRDGTRIFAIGWSRRGELIRYDEKSHHFVPYLAGISATDATFSDDGKWVAYRSYPDDTLWRSRTDGTDRVQLTYGSKLTWLPVISPDGTKVVFEDPSAWTVYVVGVDGEMPRKVAERSVSASWSLDGKSLLIDSFIPGKPVWGKNTTQLEIFDLQSGRTSIIPDSEGTQGGFWINEHTLVAATEDLSQLRTFDVNTKQWSQFFSGVLVNWFPSLDRKYLYLATGGPEPNALRIRFSDHKVEQITNLKVIHRVVGPYPYTTTLGVTPDGSLLLTRDVGTHEIYALSVRWP